jgi:hypothetical protein
LLLLLLGLLLLLLLLLGVLQHGSSTLHLFEDPAGINHP